MESICDIKEIYRRLYTFEKNFFEKNSITLNEALILCCMKNSEILSANEICEYLSLSPSRGSRVINEVEKKGFITRSMGKEDKRKMLFSLTQKGRDKTDQMGECSKEFQKLKEEIKKIL